MSGQVTITQLPAASALTGAESVPIVQNGVTVQTTTGAISGAVGSGINTGLKSAYNTTVDGTQTSNIDYSQGDVNLSSNSGNIYAAGNIIGYDKNGQPIFEPIYVTPNTTEGPNAGIGGSGAGGASENPVIDNGDGTSSVANADGSVDTYDNNTGALISHEGAYSDYSDAAYSGATLTTSETNCSAWM